MQKFLFSIALLMPLICHAKIAHHFREWEHKVSGSAVKNIDYIYVINLDMRPEKLNRTLVQLEPYGIVPERFSAIYGWDIPFPVLKDIGVHFAPGMWQGGGIVVPRTFDGKAFLIPQSEAAYGSTIFSNEINKGAIGCTLSHLSVLNDAYESNYETIWVMEDDILVLKNPHLLSSYIEELDGLIGKENWDILYTDYDYLMGLDENRDLFEQIPMKWRPDMPFFDITQFLEHTSVGEHFLKIGSRLRTHSMIIRRSGMQKILDFYKDHQVFIPFDHELFFIPDMKFFVLRDSVVSLLNPLISDIKNHHFQ